MVTYKTAAYLAAAVGAVLTGSLLAPLFAALRLIQKRAFQIFPGK